MKTLIKILLPLLCLLALCFSASAQSAVQEVHSSVSVEADGVCTVSIRFRLFLEQAQTLNLPLPDNARNVRLNGKLKTPAVRNGRTVVTLSELGAGVHTVELSYTLSDGLTVAENVYTLNIPLLENLPLPLEDFSFTVSFPSTPEGQFALSSDYYGDGIESKLEVQVIDNALVGSATEPLYDGERIVLTYLGDRAMFCDYSAPTLSLNYLQIALIGLIGLSVVYYLLALMPRFSGRMRIFAPPEGLAAGDIGTCLTGCGMDLTMMVFSWAQMGYLTICMDAGGRVRLEKRMDMGSERSSFEIRVFEKLFDRRQTVDASSLHYALLCRKTAKKSPLLGQIYASRSGNPKIVRFLAVGAGAVSGILLSQGVYTAGAGTFLLAAALGLACGLFSHAVLTVGSSLPLGNRQSLRLGALCAVLWLIVGALCGDKLSAIAMVAYELIIGLAAAVGGRRSEVGRQYVAQIHGLKRHLTAGSIFDIQLCQQKNEDYFFDLMPYALALGVEKRFARRFGKIKPETCPYLRAPAENLSPVRWAALLRQAADRLDHRQRNLHLERLLQTGHKK